MSKLLAGKIGEAFAADMLRELGYHIVTQNYHTRYGEIDIIAVKDGVMAFIEVRSRTEDALVSALESVTINKRKKIIASAYQYLDKNPSHLQPRFDVVGLITDKDSGECIELEYVENAFDVDGNTI